MRWESWLPAAPEGASRARAVVREAAAELRLDGEVTWELLLATTEAFANAVEHGSPSDSRGILLSVDSEDGGIGVEVCDWGSGFDPGTRSAKPPLEGGRGMPIIAAITDRLEVLRELGMTRVRFEKRLAAA
jgi:serine/threonine-protein kinase RsbW